MQKPLLIILTIFMLISCKTKPAIQENFEIKEPEFEVVSIFILQADIVVTKFEAVLKITNPNAFAVDLASIKYELFGNGAFWAGGSENFDLTIAPFESGETRFIFEMNFINMSRRLLDDVIAMRRVQYRFRGEAQVQPIIPRIGAFRMRYDCSGFSDVRRR